MPLQTIHLRAIFASWGILCKETLDANAVFDDRGKEVTAAETIVNPYEYCYMDSG